MSFDKNDHGFDGNASNLNSANAITLCGIILCIWVIILRHIGSVGYLTILLLVGIILTDFLDGEIARRRKTRTWLGSNLDKLRDKLCSLSHFWFMFVSYYALIKEESVSMSLILAMLLLLAFMEVVLFFGATLTWTLFGKKISANKWGKRKMACEFATILLWAIANDLGYSLKDFWPIMTIAFFLAVSIFLAGKSGAGYWNECFLNNKVPDNNGGKI